MHTDRYHKFVQLLTQLPPEVWEATVTGAAGWRWMQPLSATWEFGHFAALFVVLGLNDYQTKGKAEVGYWPKVVPLIRRASDPRDPLRLVAILQPFYERERFAQVKLKRLDRFLTSDLCNEIWSSSSASVSAHFGPIWHLLAKTMRQKPVVKTIVFAMKCLAFALLMVDETNFDYGTIPVPLDSRVRTASTRLGCRSRDDEAHRDRWKQALAQITKSDPDITMVHLDSLLWQIGTLPTRDIRRYLEQRGAGSLALPISTLFDSG